MATAQVLVNGLLLDAVKNNTVEVVDDLIRKHAADPHQVPPVSAGTLIHKAAYHSDHKQGLQIAQSLVEEHRVDALREDTYYQTPVFAAARVGNTELCGFLLKHGSSVDTADPHRQTPLFYAARHDHFATVDFLVEKGANLEQKDDQGFTPIFWAAVSGRAAMMKHLSQKGARVDALSTHGRDVLHSATGPAVRAAIELGCDPELQDAQGRTRLFQDVPRGKFEKAKVLIEYGANIDKQDIYGQTCLFHAANQCNKEAVQFLLQLGANPLISDKKKRTCRGYMESRCLMDAKLQAPVLKLLKAAEKKRQALEKKRERELQQAQRLLERRTQETPRGRKRKAANTVDEKRQNRSPPSNSKDARRPFRLVLVEHGEEVEPASQHYQKRLKKLLEEPELGRILKGAAAAA